MILTHYHTSPYSKTTVTQRAVKFKPRIRFLPTHLGATQFNWQKEISSYRTFHPGHLISSLPVMSAVL